MDFATSVKTCFGKFATFEGRASRSEFWYYTLFVFIVSVVLNIVDVAAGTGVLSLIFALVTLIPNIAVAVRRLHDTDRAGWWYLLMLVPLIGVIVLIVWFVGRGTTGTNRFGGDPLGGEALAAA